MLQDERVCRGEWKERPSDSRTGQEEQPLGGEGKMCNNVTQDVDPSVAISSGDATVHPKSLQAAPRWNISNICYQ